MPVFITNPLIQSHASYAKNKRISRHNEIVALIARALQETLKTIVVADLPEFNRQARKVLNRDNKRYDIFLVYGDTLVWLEVKTRRFRPRGARGD